MNTTWIDGRTSKYEATTQCHWVPGVDIYLKDSNKWSGSSNCGHIPLLVWTRKFNSLHFYEYHHMFSVVFCDVIDFCVCVLSIGFFFYPFCCTGVANTEFASLYGSFIPSSYCRSFWFGQLASVWRKFRFSSFSSDIGWLEWVLWLWNLGISFILYHLMNGHVTSFKKWDFLV